MSLTQEQLIKAKQAKSAEELLALAKENGMELTAEKAQRYYDVLNGEGELSDTELDAVAGGKGESPRPNQDGMEVVDVVDKDPHCPVCGSQLTYSPDVVNKSDHGAKYDIFTCGCCPPYRGCYRRYWTGPLWTKNY